MDSKELMMNIVRCGLSCADEKSPCHCIWKSQGCRNVSDFHLPEPWNGDIENAKLLFLGINPRLNPGELFPRTGNEWWTKDGGVLDEDKIEDFFKNRFCSDYEYVRHNNGQAFKVRREGDEYKGTGKGIWQYMHKLARIIVKDDVLPGCGYALSEIVHCKTHDEGGLSASCYEKCKKEWLEQVFNAARHLEYVVVLGNSAISRVAKLFSISNPEKYKWYSVNMFGRSFKVLFGYHSNGLDRKNVISTYESFQEVLKANRKEKIGVDDLPDDLKNGKNKQRKGQDKKHPENLENLRVSNQNKPKQKKEVGMPMKPSAVFNDLKTAGVRLLRSNVDNGERFLTLEPKGDNAENGFAINIGDRALFGKLIYRVEKRGGSILVRLYTAPQKYKQVAEIYNRTAIKTGELDPKEIRPDGQRQDGAGIVMPAIQCTGTIKDIKETIERDLKALYDAYDAEIRRNVR